jgi:hypothetical protein
VPDSLVGVDLRAKINRQRRKAGIRSGCAVRLLTGFWLGQDLHGIELSYREIALWGFLAIATGARDVQCPCCGEGLTFLPPRGLRGFHPLHPDLRLCPYCGVLFDEGIGADLTANRSEVEFNSGQWSTREALTAQRRRTTINLASLLLPATVASGWLGFQGFSLAAIVAPLLLVAAVVLYQVRSSPVPCNGCGRDLSFLPDEASFWWPTISSSLSWCPYCATSLDLRPVHTPERKLRGSEAAL